MVGEGVLLTCLNDERIESVLALSRRTTGISHPKLIEVLHENFHDLTEIEDRLAGYKACFFCLGVSSVGMSKKEYQYLTYDLTMHVAETLSRLNDDMSICYISGAGTDSSEKGRIHWARVKGKTENGLMKLPFKKVYAMRPGFLKPVKGQKRVLKYYRYVSWVYPFGRLFYPKGFSTILELAEAMIDLVTHGQVQNPKCKISYLRS